jgi:hypothetical protein
MALRAIPLVVLILLSACGNVRMTPHFTVADAGRLQPIVKDRDAGRVALANGFDLRRYRTLIVDRFVVTDPGLADEDDRALAQMAPGYLQEQFVQQLKESRLFERIVTPGEAASVSGAALRLAGSIAQVQGGSRHLRFWFRYGGGRSKVEIHTRLHDAVTDQLGIVTATRRVAASSEVPLSLDYGGSNEELVQHALRDSARDYARFLARVARGAAPRAD